MWSFVRLLEVNPGFRPERMMTFALSFSGPKYKDMNQHPERMARFLEALKRIETLPGVEGVASSNDLPLTGQDASNYLMPLGESAVASNDQVLVGMHAVSPGYFRAMGIALLRGREISARDVPGAPAAAVINQKFAERVWPGQDPIGKQFRLFNPEKEQPEVVVGVVANVKTNGLEERRSRQTLVNRSRSIRGQTSKLPCALRKVANLSCHPSALLLRNTIPNSP